MSRVKNKAALITGGASGLGLASGKLLLEQGAKVMFTDINQVELDNIKDQIDNKFAESYSTKLLDVTNEENWKSVLSESEEELGGLNILLNSAGITLGADIVSTSFDIWKKVHDVNLDGVFLGL
jgi:NADP-dependent 3-hydroxy acid dehydrogenase YdfG